jgi:hypothetical protein
MNTADMEEYKHFLAFKAMKAAAAAASAPDMTGAATVRTRMAAIMGGAGAAPAPARPPVRTINWEKALTGCTQYMFNTRQTNAYTSKNADWWMWRQMYIENPDKFYLIGSLHTDATTHETYISARYDFYSGAYATFHIYGNTEGFRFKVTHAHWAQNGKPEMSRPIWNIVRPSDASSESASVRSE